MQTPEWVALKAFDSDDPLYAPRAQIEEFLPVLARQVRHDPPREEGGIHFWRMPCTRDTLIGVMKSVNCNGLCVHATASQDDVLCELKRLGAAVRYKHADEYKKRHKRKKPEGEEGSYNTYHVWTPVDVNPHTQTLRGTTQELVAREQKLRQTCSELCYSISKWPRLISTPRADKGSTQANFSCSLTRVWVQFVDKPSSMTDTTRKTMTPTQFLATWEDHRWMRDIFMALMAVRFEVVMEMKGEKTSKKRLDEAKVFDRVTRKLDNHPAGSFWSVLYECGYRSSDNNKMLRLAYTPTTTQVEITAHLSQLRKALADEDSTFSKEEAARYVNWVRRECWSSVPPSTLFAADCLDKEGQSPERRALEDAFEKQGMRILCWSDTMGSSFQERKLSPAMFPPHWLGWPPPNAGASPAVLIAYGEE